MGCKVDIPLCKVGLTSCDLNPNQRRAVNWNDGPLLVLAGPGSGKTTVLTLRILRLLEEDDHASALALTFTNKAAAAMRDRVDRRLGEHSDRALLCTFHAFAVDILGQHGSHLGIRPDFRPLTQDEDRIAILEEVIRDLPGGDAELPPGCHSSFAGTATRWSPPTASTSAACSTSRTGCSGKSRRSRGWFGWDGHTYAWTSSRTRTGHSTIWSG